MTTRPLPVIFDMETNDPDDFLTLLLLLGHPAVELRAVTIMPGSAEQIGLMRRALSWFERDDVRVGAGSPKHTKSCVSPWHERAFGTITPNRDAERAGELLLELCDEETTLITGAPLINLELPYDDPSFTLGRWVAQGGFAGEGVAPAELQLPKFKGKRTCPTFNFNGAPKVTLAGLSHPGIRERRLVSKNVCHGVVWDIALHRQVDAARSRHLYLEKMWHGMDVYLQNRLGESWQDTPDEELLGKGKMLHDPLAACCAVSPDIARWREVELFRERGEWGSRLSEGTNTWITIDYEHERFVDVLCGAGA